MLLVSSAHGSSPASAAGGSTGRAAPGNQSEQCEYAGQIPNVWSSSQLLAALVAGIYLAVVQAVVLARVSAVRVLLVWVNPMHVLLGPADSAAITGGR